MTPASAPSCVRKKRPDDWLTYLTQSQLERRLGRVEPPCRGRAAGGGGYEGLKAREARIPPPRRRYLAEVAAAACPVRYEAWCKQGRRPTNGRRRSPTSQASCSPIPSRPDPRQNWTVNTAVSSGHAASGARPDAPGPVTALNPQAGSLPTRGTVLLLDALEEACQGVASTSNSADPRCEIMEVLSCSSRPSTWANVAGLHGSPCR